MAIRDFFSKLRRNKSTNHAFEAAQLAQPTKTGSKSQTWATTVTKVPSWPRTAQALKKFNWVTSMFLFGDVIMILMPVYFILLSVAVVKLNDKPVEGNAFASKVQSAIQLGPTIFPIMFAAISGRSMKMIARYLAERGARISTLELLMASQSVWGTVESQFLMRRFTIVGVNLLFLWSMSPLGGQASLRVLEKAISSNHTTMPLRYLSTGPGSAAYAMGSTFVESSDLSQIKPLYAAALLASNEVKAGPEDTWGNVTIPTNLSLAEDYYSLVGIPVMGRDKSRDAKFNLETTQLTVTCDPFGKTPVSYHNITDLERATPGPIWKNMSQDNPFGEAGVDTITFFLQTDLALTQGEDDRFAAFTGFTNQSMVRKSFRKRKITFASKLPTGRGSANLPDRVNVANCSLGQVHTEVLVECIKNRCSAVRIRKSLIDLRSEEVTPFDHHLIADQSFRYLSKAFGWFKGSSTTEQFLLNTTTFRSVSPSSTFDENGGWVDLSSLPPEVFSRRLALVLNTYYQLTLAPNSYLGNLPQNNFSQFGPDTLPVTDVNAYLPTNITAQNITYPDWYRLFNAESYKAGIFFIGATTNATVTSSRQIFKCNMVWLALLLAASGAIFFYRSGFVDTQREDAWPRVVWVCYEYDV